MTKLAVLVSFMDSVMAGPVATLIIKPGAKGTVLMAVSPDCTVTLNAPTLVFENLSEPIAVDAKTLVGACKNRDVTLAITGSEILVKSGKVYSVNVACSNDVPQVEDILAKLADATTQVELSADNMLLLRECLSRVKIEKTFTGIVDTLVAVKATAKLITVMNYEPAQVASTTMKNEGNFPECSFVLPTSVVARAMNILGNIKMTINETAAVFRGKNSAIRVNLPIDTINAINKDDVHSLVASVKEEKATKPGMLTTKVALAAFLSNAESLINVGGDVVISPASGSTITASVTTTKGTIKEKFAGSASKSFSLGFTFMRALVAHSKNEDIDIRATEAFAVVKSGSSTYIAALSADV